MVARYTFYADFMAGDMLQHFMEMHGEVLHLIDSLVS